MTSQTGSNRQGWRRVVMTGLAVSAVVAGAIAEVGAPAALADPADPNAGVLFRGRTGSAPRSFRPGPRPGL